MGEGAGSETEWVAGGGACDSAGDGRVDSDEEGAGGSGGRRLGSGGCKGGVGRTWFGVGMGDGVMGVMEVGEAITDDNCPLDVGAEENQSKSLALLMVAEGVGAAGTDESGVLHDVGRLLEPCCCMRFCEGNPRAEVVDTSLLMKGSAGEGVGAAMAEAQMLVAAAAAAAVAGAVVVVVVVVVAAICLRHRASRYVTRHLSMMALPRSTDSGTRGRGSRWVICAADVLLPGLMDSPCLGRGLYGSRSLTVRQLVHRKTFSSLGKRTFVSQHMHCLTAMLASSSCFLPVRILVGVARLPGGVSRTGTRASSGGKSAGNRRRGALLLRPKSFGNGLLIDLLCDCRPSPSTAGRARRVGDGEMDETGGGPLLRAKATLFGDTGPPAATLWTGVGAGADGVC